jgi:hypothetical protein
VLYWQALEIRLLWTIHDCFVGYFTLRNIPWRGEKAAIVWLQAQDPAFLDLIQQCLAENEIARKFQLYEKLITQTIPDEMGMWNAAATTVVLNHSYSSESIRTSLGFWNELIGE